MLTSVGSTGRGGARLHDLERDAGDIADDLRVAHTGCELHLLRQEPEELDDARGPQAAAAIGLRLLQEVDVGEVAEGCGELLADAVDVDEARDVEAVQRHRVAERRAHARPRAQLHRVVAHAEAEERAAVRVGPCKQREQGAVVKHRRGLPERVEHVRRLLCELLGEHCEWVK